MVLKKTSNLIIKFFLSFVLGYPLPGGAMTHPQEPEYSGPVGGRAPLSSASHLKDQATDKATTAASADVWAARFQAPDHTQFMPLTQTIQRYLDHNSNTDLLEKAFQDFQQTKWPAYSINETLHYWLFETGSAETGDCRRTASCP
ncbi:MAG: hypothetical protein ACK5PQ_00500 [Alphaproteobacteria bacterium]